MSYSPMVLQAYPSQYVERGMAEWPEVSEGDEMEFRLIYKGRLPAVSGNDTRVKDKHRIRRMLHPQLRSLWETHPYLKSFLRDAPDGRRIIDRWADDYAKCGYRFLPLVGKFEMVCALDILFLRRDYPGNLIAHGGDIDNRIKVLFDALQVPDECSQIPRDSLPTEDENPLFCLLKNDNLITEVKVTTDRLLTPMEEDEGKNDVELVIHIRTGSVGSRSTTIALL